MTTITTRKDLGKLYQTHFKTGIGAEIGVQNGYNAKSILEHWQGEILLVDTWPDIETLNTAREVLNPETDNRVKMLQKTSLDAAAMIPNGSLDFCYIDADHAYEAVKADFNAWFPKVRSGGIISFHDYGVNDCIGVKTFIDEYIIAHPEIKWYFTTEDFWNGLEYQTAWFIK